MGGRESSCGDAAVWQLCRQLFMGRFDLIKSCWQAGTTAAAGQAHEAGMRGTLARRGTEARNAGWRGEPMVMGVSELCARD